VKGIADTGFLVAFVNRSDEYHDWDLIYSGDSPLRTGYRYRALMDAATP
jgi:hypothetical protein